MAFLIQNDTVRCCGYAAIRCHLLIGWSNGMVLSQTAVRHSRIGAAGQAACADGGNNASTMNLPLFLPFLLTNFIVCDCCCCWSCCQDGCVLEFDDPDIAANPREPDICKAIARLARARLARMYSIQVCRICIDRSPTTSLLDAVPSPSEPGCTTVQTQLQKHPTLPRSNSRTRFLPKKLLLPFKVFLYKAVLPSIFGPCSLDSGMAMMRKNRRCLTRRKDRSYST